MRQWFIVQSILHYATSSYVCFCVLLPFRLGLRHLNSTILRLLAKEYFIHITILSNRQTRFHDIYWRIFDKIEFTLLTYSRTSRAMANKIGFISCQSSCYSIWLHVKYFTDIRAQPMFNWCCKANSSTSAQWALHIKPVRFLQKSCLNYRKWLHWLTINGDRFKMQCPMSLECNY